MIDDDEDDSGIEGSYTKAEVPKDEALPDTDAAGTSNQGYTLT